jgi:hypothetical protein
VDSPDPRRQHEEAAAMPVHLNHTILHASDQQVGSGRRTGERRVGSGRRTGERRVGSG